MKTFKRLTSVFILFLVFLGCSNEKEEDYLLEGRYSGLGFYQYYEATEEMILNVFVEDNLFGSYFKSQFWDEVPADYEVEAYKVIVNEDTKFYRGDTEEELDIKPLTYENPLFRQHGNKISILLDTPLERRSFNRNEYILYNNNLLPIYTAKEVRLYEQSKQEFIRISSPHQRGNYLLLAFYEEDSQENWEHFHEIDQQIYSIRFREANSYFHAWFQSREYNEQSIATLGIEEFPTYILLSEKGMEMETTDRDEVLSFIEEIQQNDN